MNLPSRPRHKFSPRQRVLVVLLLMVTIVAVLIMMRNRRQSLIVRVPLDMKNPFIVKLQNGEANVQMLVNALGSPDEKTRRHASRAIVALRQHYIEEVATVVQEGYDNGLNGSLWATPRKHVWWMPWKRVGTVFGGPAPPEVDVQLRAMYLLAAMRPSDPIILRGAAQHTSFNHYHLGGNALTVSSVPATEILIGSSLASLPILLEDSINEPTSPKSWLEAPATTCLTTILGAMSSSWVKQRAGKHAQLKPLSKKLTTDPRFSWESGFDYLNIDPASYIVPTMEWMYKERQDVKMFDREIAQAAPIEWNIRLKLLDDHDLGVSTPPYPLSSQAVAEINRPLRLLQYAVAQRLYSLKYDGRFHRAWAKNIFPEAARLDAIRILGAVRSREEHALDWMQNRLFELDKQTPLEQNTSPEVLALLRSIAQIDVPFARRLIDSSNQGDETSREVVVATYLLSKLFGRYSEELVNYEIGKSKREDVPGVGKDKRFWLQRQHLLWENARIVAREKGWFNGELFDSQKPHAYDLVLPGDKSSL